MSTDIETELFELKARVNTAEGRLWGLTELLKALIKLEALPSGIVKKQMREMRDILAARNPSLDEPTNDFIEAARKLIDDLLEGSNLTPPPRFGIVQGGKTDKPD